MEEQKKQEQKQKAPDKGVVQKPPMGDMDEKMTFRQKAKTDLRPYASILLLGLINVIIIIVLLFVLGQLPHKASEVKVARNRQIKNISGGDVEAVKREIERNSIKIQVIRDLYPDQTEVISFVNAIDSLKEEGTLVNFSFASEAPVVDRLGFKALPVVITISGDVDSIRSGLSSIDNLPYVLRPVTVEMTRSEDETSFVLQYGGVLYVSESFEEN